MQGIYLWIDGGDDHDGFVRPKSKKQVREYMATEEGRKRVHIEATSLFGNEYEGNATAMPIGKPIYFVGPDPQRKRNFYGVITRTADNEWKVA